MRFSPWSPRKCPFVPYPSSTCNTPFLTAYGNMEGERIGPSAPGLEELDIDGRVNLYHPTLDQVLVLNETASDVWRLCDGEHTLEEIVNLLTHAYGVDQLRVRAEVLATVQRFQREGLLA